MHITKIKCQRDVRPPLGRGQGGRNSRRMARPSKGNLAPTDHYQELQCRIRTR